MYFDFYEFLFYAERLDEELTGKWIYEIAVDLCFPGCYLHVLFGIFHVR